DLEGALAETHGLAHLDWEDVVAAAPTRGRLLERARAQAGVRLIGGVPVKRPPVLVEHHRRVHRAVEQLPADLRDGVDHPRPLDRLRQGYCSARKERYRSGMSSNSIRIPHLSHLKSGTRCRSRVGKCWSTSSSLSSSALQPSQT